MKISTIITQIQITLFMLIINGTIAQSISLNFDSSNDTESINTQLNGFNMGPSFNEIFTASSMRNPIRERCLIKNNFNEYRIVSMKANEDFVSKSVELKPSVLRFPGGTIANYYHLYEYSSESYDPDNPVFARGFGTTDNETKAYPQSNVIRKQYCLDDNLIELEDPQENPNYINGFSNYINQLESEVRENDDPDYKIDVIYVANVLTHFDFKYLFNTTKHQQLKPSDPTDILNINDPSIIFELYYKETIDAIRLLKSKGVNVVGVEMGNELYFGVYDRNNNITPKKYMDLCQIYSARIKAEYPKMKVAIVSDSKIPKWDNVIASHSPSFFEAIVLHKYYNKQTCIDPNNSSDQSCTDYLDDRKCRFQCGKHALSNFINNELLEDFENTLMRYPKDKKIWMTEWGIISPQNTKANNLDYLNTFLYACFTTEHLLQQMQFNQMNDSRLEYSTHHRLGYKINWSVIQMELGNTESIKRANFYSYKMLNKIFYNNEVSFFGEISEMEIDHQSDFYAKSFIIRNQKELPELFLYYSNKTEDEIELASGFLEKTITIDNIDYKFQQEGSSSYLKAKKEQGLYASFGRTKFNKETYDNEDSSTLGYIADINLDLQSYNIPAYSMGYIKISLEKSTSVNHSKTNSQIQFANPNPVGDYLFLNAAFEQGPSSIHVYDANGREIQLRKKTLNGVVQMETGSISKGIFFVKLNNQMKNSVYKFIKE